MSCIRLVCQPADRRVMQVQVICHLSLAIPVTIDRLDNPGAPLGFGELSFKQRLQCRPAQISLASRDLRNLLRPLHIALELSDKVLIS